MSGQGLSLQGSPDCRVRPCYSGYTGLNPVFNQFRPKLDGFICGMGSRPVSASLFTNCLFLGLLRSRPESSAAILTNSLHRGGVGPSLIICGLYAG
jgi:hypothetical protein